MLNSNTKWLTSDPLRITNNCINSFLYIIMTDLERLLARDEGTIWYREAYVLNKLDTENLQIYDSFLLIVNMCI